MRLTPGKLQLTAGRTLHWPVRRHTSLTVCRWLADSEVSEAQLCTKLESGMVHIWMQDWSVRLFILQSSHWTGELKPAAVWPARKCFFVWSRTPDAKSSPLFFHLKFQLRIVHFVKANCVFRPLFILLKEKLHLNYVSCSLRKHIIFFFFFFNNLLIPSFVQKASQWSSRWMLKSPSGSSFKLDSIRRGFLSFIQKK